MESWSDALVGVYDEAALRELLQTAATGAFGTILRLKGIAEVRRGWINFDLAGGHTSITAFAAREGEQARVVAIGDSVDAAALQAALHACRLDQGENRARLAPVISA
jgi:G3E family GTPase